MNIEVGKWEQFTGNPTNPSRPPLSASLLREWRSKGRGPVSLPRLHMDTLLKHSIQSVEFNHRALECDRLGETEMRRYLPCVEFSRPAHSDLLKCVRDVTVGREDVKVQDKGGGNAIWSLNRAQEQTSAQRKWCLLLSNAKYRKCGRCYRCVFICPF